MEQTTQGLSIVAAQLIEAACRARDGDRETAQVYIARAMALLEGHPATSPVPANRIRPAAPPRRRGGLAAWQVRRLAVHIDAHLARRISIDELATLLGLSKCHFCRAFKSTVGVTAHAWVTHRRVELAQALMLTTSATLSEIALSCGMSDQSHFTRSFRRLLGETPHSWRRTRRGAVEDRMTSLAHTDAESTTFSTRQPRSGLAHATAAFVSHSAD